MIAGHLGHKKRIAHNPYCIGATDENLNDIDS
jgi:hypothetical protein